jgi:16S rRNA (uracil1498-N3)-methyltransferase
MTTRPDRTIPFAFVDDLDVPVLDADARHHLERVRRLRPGEALTVGDGRGRFRVVRFGADLVADGPIEQVCRDIPCVTVAFALTKSDKPELVVQKLTELDVDRIVPFVAARTVVRWDSGKVARNVERWRTIAREAAAQAHRPWLPEITDVATFAQVIDADGVTVADPDGEPPTLDRPTVLVGPEGGWAPEELAAAPHRTRLPGNVLRAETAAVVAGALLVALRAR